MHHYEVHSWPHKEDEAAAIWLQNTDGSGLNNGSLLLVRDRHCYGVVCVPLKSVLSVSKYCVSELHIINQYSISPLANGEQTMVCSGTLLRPCTIESGLLIPSCADI